MGGTGDPHFCLLPRDQGQCLGRITGSTGRRDDPGRAAHAPKEAACWSGRRGTANRLTLKPPVATGSMLVRTHDRPVDEQIVELGILGQRDQDLVPDALDAPAAEPPEPRVQKNCLVPKCGGTVDQHAAREALWAGFSTAAPVRQKAVRRDPATPRQRESAGQALGRQPHHDPEVAQAVGGRGRAHGAERGSLDGPDVRRRGHHRRLPSAHAPAAGRLPLQPAADHPAPDPLVFARCLARPVRCAAIPPVDRAEAQWDQPPAGDRGRQA